MAKFVSEVSSNHEQEMKRCLEFIDSSAAIGCDAVKFQLFKVEELFAPEILSKSPDHRARKAWELPEEFLPELSQYTHEKNMEFACTPFYLKAVATLFPFVDFYKIASYELLWSDLLSECARTGKPVVLATGMASIDEVKAAVEVLKKNNCRNLTILHCVSAYPVPPEDCNLAAIDTLRREFGVNTGWSDHSVNPLVIHRAVHHFKADMIEFHLDIDGKGAEFSSGHCWLPEAMRQTIKNIRSGRPGKDWAFADGSGIKQPVASELHDVAWRADPEDGLRPLQQIRETFFS